MSRTALLYLKKLRPILNRVGKKHNITIEEGEFIIHSYFKSIRDKLFDARMPTVHIPCFGVVRPRLGLIYKSIKQSIAWHKKGATTRDYIDAKIKYLWAVRKRLLDEKFGIETWSKYKSKEVKQEFEKLKENEQIQKKRSAKELFPGTNEDRIRRRAEISRRYHNSSE